MHPLAQPLGSRRRALCHLWGEAFIWDVRGSDSSNDTSRLRGARAQGCLRDSRMVGEFWLSQKNCGTGVITLASSVTNRPSASNSHRGGMLSLS
jgi:hypothetical protein